MKYYGKIKLCFAALLYSFLLTSSAVAHEDGHSDVDGHSDYQFDHHDFQKDEESAVDHDHTAEESCPVENHDHDKAEKHPHDHDHVADSHGIWQSFHLDLSLTGNLALAYFSGDHGETGDHDPQEQGFNFQQLELIFGAAMTTHFRADANIVFTLEGVEVEEVYLSALKLPGNFKVRAGQFLSPVGRINSQHPHSWDFVDQPLVIGKFYGAEGNRGLGLEIGWQPPLTWHLELLLVAQMANSSEASRSFLDDEAELTGPQDLLYTVALKQQLALGEAVKLNWGLSGQFGANWSGEGKRSYIYATDLLLKYSPSKHKEMALAIQTELFFRLRETMAGPLFDGAGYAQLVWQINHHFSTGMRGEYGSGLTSDYLDPEWISDRWRVAYQLSWSPNHFVKLRGQASVDIPTWQEKPVYALFLALEFTAGSHPAHDD